MLLYDVFRGSSIGAFRAYTQQAQDIVLKGVTDPEAIFDHLQSKYEELLLADRWVATKKSKSAFVLADGKTRTYKEADKDKDGDDSKKSKSNKSSTRRTRPTHDKSGRKIDYTPPKPGEPHVRVRDGVTEYWCGICGRWGNHPGEGHDEFRAKFSKKGKKNGSSNGSSNNGSNGGSNGGANANAAGASSTTNTPGSTTPARGAVTFVSALTGNYCLQVDSDLADGIDLA